MWAISCGELYYAELIIYQWDTLEEIEQYYMIAFYDIQLNAYLTCANMYCLITMFKHDEDATYIYYKLIESSYTKQGLFRKTASGFKHTTVFFIEGR
jgi:hypothetical protein